MRWSSLPWKICRPTLPDESRTSELLGIMGEPHMDFTNTFRDISAALMTAGAPVGTEEFKTSRGLAGTNLEQKKAAYSAALSSVPPPPCSGVSDLSNL